MAFDHQQRLAVCSRLMEEESLDALLLTKPANMFYLTGDGRLCAFAFITREGNVALGVPSTDVEDVSRLAHFDHVEGFEDEVGMIHSINHTFERFGIDNGAVGLEYTFLTQSMMGMLTHPHAKPTGVTVADATHVLSQLRLVKDEQELERIRAAAKVADTGMEAAIAACHPGRAESEVAAEAEYAMRRTGAENFWSTYVSSGPRTNIAHGFPTGRVLEDGDPVMIDIHPIVTGYSADICRTVCAGRPSVDMQTAYDAFRAAQKAAIEKTRAGVQIGELEETMHRTLRKEGYGEFIFGPPVHGVGIEFEEAPLPPGHAFFHGEKELPALSANVVVAVGNCGLYTGPWGVRVEDTVILGPSDPEVLTHYPRSLSV